MVSCSGGMGTSDLSKSKILEYIVAENGTQSETFIIPEKLVSVKEMNTHCNTDILKLYASYGLVTVKDSTVTYRQWGSTKSYEAVEAKLTTQGATALIEHTPKGAKILRYSYEYDKIVDMDLLARKYDEDLKAELVVYAVFYTGKVTAASPFITCFGVDVDSIYPLSNEEEEAYVKATTIKAIFRNGKAIYIDGSNTQTISKSEMEAYSNEAWLEILEKSSYFAH